MDVIQLYWLLVGLVLSNLLNSFAFSSLVLKMNNPSHDPKFSSLHIFGTCERKKTSAQSKGPILAKSNITSPFFIQFSLLVNNNDVVVDGLFISLSSFALLLR